MKKVLIAALAIALCLGLAGVSVFSKPQTHGAKNSKSPETAWLGVLSQTVDKDIADAFDVDVDYGAIINDVIDESPAEKADMKDGDVIISFNGQKVWDQDDLTDFIDESGAGSNVKLGIVRDGKEMTVSVELGSRPKGMSWSSRNGNAPGAALFNGPRDMQIFHWGGGYIGVQLSELTDQLAQYFGVAGGEGVLITEVNEDSPAQKAGLKAGDIITAINDEKVSDYGDVKEIVSESDQGDKLAVSIVRDKKEQNIEVVVEESDESDNEFGYQFFQVPPVPDIPDIDARVPMIRGNFNRDKDNSGAYFDYDHYKVDMESFKAEMEKYKEEMKALSKDMKRYNKVDQQDLERQIEELRAKLLELEKKNK